MKKEKKVPILWEKTYRDKNFFDNSHDFRGKKTGKWNGVLMIYRFLILQYRNGNRFIVKPDAIGFEGKNEKEMLDNLERSASKYEEWDLGDKNWRNADFFPKEADQNLIKFNLQKYVKVS